MSSLSMRVQALQMRRTDEMSGRYVFDPTHSRIGFVTRHAMVTRVRGQFNDIAGSAVVDFTDPSASSAELTIQVASVDTRDPHRDEHLRTNDFFDAPHFPTITFRSSGIERLDERVHRVSGDLTIKATTRAITLDMEYMGAAKDPFGTTRLGFEGTTSIKRTDYDVVWNAPLETGGVLVSETVVLEFEISAVPTPG